jgi:hypothetical protein
LALIVLLAVIAAAFAISRACGDDDEGGGPVPSGVTPTPELSRERETERDGIRLRISVEKDEFEAGEEIVARASVKNERDDTVSYEAPPGLTGFRIATVSELGGEQGLELEGDDPPPAQGALEAGAELEARATWDQRLDLGDPVQAPDGRYSIQATFVYRLPGAAEAVALRASATFTLEGGGFIVDPRSALEIAVGNAEVGAWESGRSDRNNVICAYPPRGLFYQGFFTNKTAAETLQFLYQDQLDRGLPICGIVAEGSNWRLIFFSRDGPEPRRMSAFIDLDSGEFIRFEEGGPQTAATPAPDPSPGP